MWVRHQSFEAFRLKNPVPEMSVLTQQVKLGMSASVSVPGLNPGYSTSDPAPCYCILGGSKVLGSLPPMGDTQMALQAPSLGLAQLQLSQVFGECIVGWKIALSILSVALPFKKPSAHHWKSPPVLF